MSATVDAPGRPTKPVPSFDAFYRAINGRTPFPWQARLAVDVAKTDQWPDEIGVPSGLGKTACLDIAVWWLASQGLREPRQRTAPTRIWWVVNRCQLVDAAWEHAKFIGHALADPASQGITGASAAVVTAVADRLRALSADEGRRKPLDVIPLRGGPGLGRPVDPSKPTVVLSTLPMYGSSLLFRSYGSTRSMRPINAALAGTDSLVLLDEAHAAPHLRALLLALRECTPGARPVLGTGRAWPRLVALTATGGIGIRNRFELDSDDKAHPIVLQRLDAAKPTQVRVLGPGDAGPPLVDAALGLLEEAAQPSACSVFANTPRTARAVFDALRGRLTEADAEILLLTGSIREREAELIRKRVLDPVNGMAAGRDGSVSRQRHLVVVATQTLEVGADIDAEFLVTEACGVRALTQRLGRLNRLGRHRHARAVYIHCPPTAKASGKPARDPESWPVYGQEPIEVLRRLQEAGGNESVNLSPARVGGILGTPRDDPGRAPEVLPGILWEWVKTTTPPAGEAPVEPYFSGIAGTDYRVSVLWRSQVPEDGKWLWPRAGDRETISVPISEFRVSVADGAAVHRIDVDGVTIRRVSKRDLRPGDTLVLPSDGGLMDDFGWNRTSSQPVMDLSMVGRGVPLDAAALGRLGVSGLYESVSRALGVAGDDEELDEIDQEHALAEIRTKLSEVTPPGWADSDWRDLVGRLSEGRIVDAPNEAAWLLAPGSDSRRGPSSEELDETSLSAIDLRLDRHGDEVGKRARAVAEQLGMASRLVEILHVAGRLHDIGKTDQRFQRWLNPDGNLCGNAAKSGLPRHLWERARVAAGWPRGGRHEALSALLVDQWLRSCDGRWHRASSDLLLHLIVSHHGNGRPLVRPVEDGTPAKVSADLGGIPVGTPADLSVPDWEQPARFLRLCRRYGPWGLALLEAIVRQSDHSVSAGSDVNRREEC